MNVRAWVRLLLHLPPNPQDVTQAVLQHQQAQRDEVDEWLAARRVARAANEAAEQVPYLRFADHMAEGEKLAKEEARKLLSPMGVKDETFEKAWATNP